MYKCKIYLCAFLYTLQSPQLFVVSKNKTNYSPLECEIIPNNSVKNTLLNLIDDHIDRAVNKISPFLLDVQAEDDCINIYYTCVLPIGAKLTKGYYTRYQDAALHPLVKKSISYV